LVVLKIDDIDIKIGLEEEIFLTNSKGFLLPYSEHVSSILISLLRKNEKLLEKAQYYLFGLQWEPNPSQIEYVTRPLSIDHLRDAIIFSRELIAKAVSEIEGKIYIGSAHPVQSTPYPLNGVHISISIKRKNKKRPTIKALQYIHNHIRNHLPELIALSANSPICRGEYTGYVSSRLYYSRVLSPANYAVIKRIPISFVPRQKRSIFRYIVLFGKKKTKEAKIIAHDDGLRLLDITPRGPLTNIIEDIAKRDNESRIEIRAIDVQSSEDYIMDIVKIIIGLSLEALDKMLRGEVIRERENLMENRQRAIKDGINAVFINKEKEIIAQESILTMIERIEKYLDLLDLKLTTPLRRGIPEIEFYGLPEIVDENPKLFELIKKGRVIIGLKCKDEKRYYPIMPYDAKVANHEDLEGILFADYDLEWFESPRNIIRRFTKIERRYWILTSLGYVKIGRFDRIKYARNPISHLVRIFNKMAGIS